MGGVKQVVNVLLTTNLHKSSLNAHQREVGQMEQPVQGREGDFPIQESINSVNKDSA